MATHTSTTPFSANEASCVSPSARQFAIVLAALQKSTRHERRLENLEGLSPNEMHYWMLEADQALDRLTDALLDMHLIVVCPAVDRPLHRMAVLLDEILNRPSPKRSDALAYQLRYAFERDFQITEDTPYASHNAHLLRRARELILSMMGFNFSDRVAAMAVEPRPDAFRLFAPV